MPLEALRYCVVDLETTGGSPGRSRITEIGAVRVAGLAPAERFCTLVDPRCPIPPVVRTLTGIDDDMVAGAPPVADALARFAAFAGQDVLVAHNAPFDLRFLNYERRRLDGGFFLQPWLDTLTLARRLLEGRVARHDLGTLAAWAGTRVRPAHRALPDAEATAELLVRLIELARRRGLRTLADLHDLVGAPEAAYSHRTALCEDLPARMGVYVLRGADGEALHVGGSPNLRRDVRRLFQPGGRRAGRLQRAIAATELVEHEVHGSRLGMMLRIEELTRRAGLPAGRSPGGSMRHIVLVDGGRHAPARVVGAPAEGAQAFGPLRGERRLRDAVDCLRALFSAPAGYGPRQAAEVRALLGGDARALGRLPRHLQRAGAAGHLDAGAPDGRAMVDALTSVLHDLAAARRMRARRVVLLEEGPEPGLAEAFFVAGGVVVARVLLGPHDWREQAAEGLVRVRSAPVSGPLPVRLHRSADLIEERLVQRAAHPGVVRLDGAWDTGEALEAVGRAMAAAARPVGDEDRARTLTA
jgi:DNA polymerase III epsilon subunit family exonuclease